MKKYLTLITVIVLLLGVFLIATQPVFAQGIVPSGCERVVDGKIVEDCTVYHLIELMINIAKWILGVAGSIALIYFVYGGFLWITAAGSSSRVDEGRKMIVGAVTGVVIILLAFTFVRFIGDIFIVDSRFDKYLEDGGSVSGCKNDGDACTINGQNVYACVGGICDSTTTLCKYWSDASRAGTRYNLTTNHACTDTIANPSCTNRKPGLCSGGDNILCCTP